MRAVRYKDSELQMPPENKLSDAEIDLLAQWIKMGAPDPRQGDAADPTAPRKKMGMSVAEGRDFWAFQPVVRPELPAVRDMSLAATPIDRFVLAALEEKGLAPVAPASRRVLIRRAYFDLTGLPPTPEQVERFVNDPRPTPSRRSSTSCWSRPLTASGGAGTGSTSRGMRTRTASTRTSPSATRGGTATTSSRRSTATSRTTSSSGNRSRGTSSRPTTLLSAMSG